MDDKSKKAYIQQIKKGKAQESDSIKEDSFSKKEEKSFKSASYEKYTDNDLAHLNRNRSEEIRKVFHNLFIWGLQVIGFFIIIIFAARAWHMIAPACLTWLSDSQLTGIDRVLFSGVVGGLISQYLLPVVNGKNAGDNMD